MLVCSSGCNQKPQSTVEAAAAAAKLYKGPAVADFAVWRPYIQVGGLVIDPDQGVATAFALSVAKPKSPLLVTLLHPALQVDSPVTDPKLAKASREDVRRIMITEAFGAGDEMRAVGPLFVPGSDAADEPGTKANTMSPLSNDLLFIDPAKFKRRLKPLSIAQETPEPGDTVWMATAVYGGASPSTVAHQAVLTQCSPDGQWEYGAPLLNSAGEVVGIHLTSGGENDGVNGVGISAKLLRQQLESLTVPVVAPSE